MIVDLRVARKNRKAVLYFCLGLLSFAGAIIAGVPGWWGRRVLRDIPPEPEQISVGNLETSTGTSLRYVQVTGFNCASGYLADQGVPNWKRVWVPLVQPAHTDSSFRVVAMSFQVKNERELKSFCGRASLTGFLSPNGAISSNVALKRYFERLYGKRDFSQLMLLDVNKMYPTPSAVALQLGLHFFFLITSVAAFWTGKRAWIRQARSHVA